MCDVSLGSSHPFRKLQRIEHELNETSADLRQKSHVEMKVHPSSIISKHLSTLFFLSRVLKRRTDYTKSLK